MLDRIRRDFVHIFEVVSSLKLEKGNPQGHRFMAIGDLLPMQLGNGKHYLA